MRYVSVSGRVLMAAIFGILLTFAAMPSAMASSGATQVAGLLAPDTEGVCVGEASVQPPGVVTGSLNGCWYITSITKQSDNPAGGFYAAGTETFAGCLADSCGRLFTTFTFTAKFASDGSEVHGRCHHPIVGGDGDFIGASGEINMHDLPNGCATYKGNLRF